MNLYPHRLLFAASVETRKALACDCGLRNTAPRSRPYPLSATLEAPAGASRSRLACLYSFSHSRGATVPGAEVTA